MHPIIDIGSLRLPTFGVMLFVGWLAVLAGLVRQSRVHTMSYTLLYRTTLAAFVAALIGSRLLYVLLVEPPTSFADLFDASRGTMYYGFLAGAAAGALGYLSARRIEALPVLDACIPAWLLMQFTGRIGCFLAGCCYGMACDLPWSVSFSHPMSQAPLHVDLHPTQLYEALGVVVILSGLLFLGRLRTSHGVVTYSYLASYAVLRFFIETLRADERGAMLGGALSISQTISLLIIPIAVIALLRSLRREVHVDLRLRWRQLWNG